MLKVYSVDTLSIVKYIDNIIMKVDKEVKKCLKKQIGINLDCRNIRFRRII